MTRTEEKGTKNGKLRFGLIGCGRIAQSHLDALSSVPEAHLSAVVEPRRPAGRATAEQHHSQWFKGPEDPEVSEMIDAVIVCCPPAFHFEIVKHFLEEGVHHGRAQARERLADDRLRRSRTTCGVE